MCLPVTYDGEALTTYPVEALNIAPAEAAEIAAVTPDAARRLQT
jgi:hypothetical protein